MGGIALHNGKIAEMRTGEGKTLVATLPAYLNALAGAGRAHRHRQRLSRAARRGLDGQDLPVSRAHRRREPVAHGARSEASTPTRADITYGTNNEFGFDYLRDNMVYHVSEKVQRGLSYAIVDEVDSILIDEARTPLIISGQAEDTTDLYIRMNQIAPKLVRQKEEKEETARATTGSTRSSTR